MCLEIMERLQTEPNLLHSVITEDKTVGFEGFEGQGLRARLCCRRYLTPYFGYIILPHVDCPAQCLAQRKSQKKYTKRKDRNR